MEYNLTTILEMIHSPDPETIYLAACLLRKSDKIPFETKRGLLSGISLENKFHCYQDILQEFNETEIVISHFDHIHESQRRITWATTIIRQIARCLNGDWKVNLKDSNQSIYYPYFARTSSGLSFRYSYGIGGYFDGAVAYFCDEKTSDFMGKTFIDLYNDLY